MKQEEPHKIAIVHDWLNGMRGGEKVLEAVLEIFPQSDIFTLHLDREKLSPFLQQQRIFTSKLQRMPFVRKRYRYYLPLFPRFIRGFHFEGYDLVLSLNHCAAKGVTVPDTIPHICYCFTPMRYAWHLYQDYFGSSGAKKLLVDVLMKRLRRWDRATAAGVDQFIAISDHIATRIHECYDRQAEVVYPPVDTEFFQPDFSEPPGDYYLMISALVPYKKVEVAVRAFNMVGLPLRIVGTGPEYQRLKAIAKDNISFHGWLSNEQVLAMYQRCKAFVFPGQEDFGIAPVEAMACGRPVIAYGKGGVTETVVDNVTGVFFDKQMPGTLVEAIRRFEQHRFEPEELRRHSLQFSRDRFKAELKASVMNAYKAFTPGARG